MLRKTTALAVLLYSVAAHPCKLTGLEHQVSFQPGESQLSAKEVAQLADWNAQTKLNFPSGGKYAIFVRDADVSSHDATVVTSRLRSLSNALVAVGVAGDKVEYSELDERSEQGLGSPHNAKPIGTAFVVFQPACPNACCPGPEPISKP